MRSRKVIFSPQDDYIYLQKLQIEADYFQLQELCHAIEAELNKRNSSSSTEDNNNDFIYRSVRAAEVNAFFNRAWEYVGHYQGNESVACLVSMTGSKVEALFLNGHCSACGEAMSFEKFCRHTSIIHPSMIVIRRKKPSKNVDSGEEELLDQSSMSEILENFLL